MSRPIQPFLSALLLLGSAAPLVAQPPRSRPWTITVAGGGGWGGPSGGMGTRLTQEGFDDKNVCLIILCADYPLIHGQGAQWSIAVGRRIGRKIEVRTIVSGGELGWASGSRDGAVVTRNWSSTTVGALLALELPPAFRLGAGPLLGWLWSGEGAPGNPLTADSGSTVVRPGLLLEAGFRSSARKRVFLDFSASYRLLPPRSEGPHPSKDLLGGPGPELSRFDANYSHFTIGIGLGVRF